MRGRINTLTVAFAIVALAGSCARRPLKVDEIGGGTLATMRPPEDIRSLHDPELLDATSAARAMRPQEKVVGFDMGGRSIAIALGVLDDHEIVNLSSAHDPGSAYAATW
jgi:hypothetical protein